MQRISGDFRQKYLDAHEVYLDSINAILPYPIATIVQRIDIPNEAIDELRKRRECDQAQSLWNMRNAWYHECSFWHPRDTGDDEWSKFAPWKIIQFYYSIYCMLSAMVRCVDTSPRIGHKKMLDKFTKGLVMHPILNQKLFIVPFCFYMDKGILYPKPEDLIHRRYALENDFPHLKQCFDNIPNSSTKPVSLFHYFKCLREWANYEDSYIFMNLYGPGVRQKLKNCLQNILSAFLCLGEELLLAFWGPNMIQVEFNEFTSKMTMVNKFEPSSLQSRFEEYNLA